MTPWVVPWVTPVSMELSASELKLCLFPVLLSLNATLHRLTVLFMVSRGEGWGKHNFSDTFLHLVPHLGCFLVALLLRICHGIGRIPGNTTHDV